MRAERGDAMRNARRLDGQRKATLVAAAVEAALQRGQHLTIAAVARDAGVGRKFIYDHPELRAEIELKAAQAAHQQANTMIAAARVTGASLRADLENSRAQNRRLQQQRRNLENRLSHVEGARLVADDLLPSDVTPSSPISNSRNASPNSNSSCSRPPKRSAEQPRSSKPPGPSTANSCITPTAPIRQPNSRHL